MWLLSEDNTRLHRFWYLQNIFCAVEFVKDIYSADAITTQQLPNVSIVDQDLVKVELHTSALKGLSYRDFTLAAVIDAFDFENKYRLIPLEKEQGYKKVIRHMKIEEEMRQMELEIRATEGIKKNKFQGSAFDKSFN